MNYSSREFIEKLKVRDPDAITSLINDYQETLIKGAMKQGLSFDQAESVVQNTWFTVFESIERFEGRSHIRTYIFGIMLNKCREAFRDIKKYTEDYDESALDQIFNEDGSYHTPPSNPEKWSENQELGIILKEEIEKLPANQREAFTLKEVEGLETEEICNILQVSHTNLGVLIYRAKNNLIIALQRRLNQ